MKYAELLKGRSAVRLSEFESFDTVQSLSGLINWVWIDCFTHMPLSKEIIQRLNEYEFKTCLVSPELQGRFDEDEIEQISNQIDALNFSPDAICTKRPDLWERYYDLNR